MVDLVPVGRKPRDRAKAFGCHADSINTGVSQHGESKSGVGAGVLPLNPLCQYDLLLHLPPHTPPRTPPRTPTRWPKPTGSCSRPASR